MVLALDGKVMRGAWTDENDQFTLFSAMIHGTGVTVAQVRVPRGTNEITQVEALLDGVLARAGERVVVTMDAAHTQRDTAEYLKGKRGFDYVMTVSVIHSSYHVGARNAAGLRDLRVFVDHAADSITSDDLDIASFGTVQRS